jgi:hypothetical protein
MIIIRINSNGSSLNHKTSLVVYLMVSDDRKEAFTIYYVNVNSQSG